MFPAGLYRIRPADARDAAALHRLTTLDSGRPLRRPVLVGELDGSVAAAISLADGRSASDPRRPTAQLRSFLRMRADATRKATASPSLRDRLLAAVPTRLGGRGAPEPADA